MYFSTSCCSFLRWFALNFFASGRGLTHCCRALTSALARFSCLIFGTLVIHNINELLLMQFYLCNILTKLHYCKWRKLPSHCMAANIEPRRSWRICLIQVLKKTKSSSKVCMNVNVRTLYFERVCVNAKGNHFEHFLHFLHYNRLYSEPHTISRRNMQFERR